MIKALLHAESITIEKLLQAASEESSRLKLYKIDEKIERARYHALSSEYYPTLGVSYNTEYNRDENGLPFGTESVGDTVITSGTRYQSSLSLNMNYELYHFGTTIKSREIAEREVKLKYLLWCEEEKKLYQSILERYNSALKMKIQSDLKQKMLEVRQDLYEIKKRLYRAGRSSKVDLGDEAIFIIDLERDIEQAKMQYQDDIVNLSALSHIDLDEEHSVLLEIGYQQTDVLVDDFEETTEGYRYTQLIHQKEEAISQYRRTQFPTISMYGNYYFYGSDPDDAYDSFDAIHKNSWKLGVAIRISLFEGFKYDKESDRLDLELQRVKQERELRKREYEYDAKSKANKIIHLVALQHKDERLYNEAQEKIKMIDRLRNSYQVDSVSELTTKLEGYERELNLKIEMSETAYENASLHILYRGVDQCTQH